MGPQFPPLRCFQWQRSCYSFDTGPCTFGSISICPAHLKMQGDHLQSNSVGRNVFSSCRLESIPPRSISLSCISILAAVCIVAVQTAHSQQLSPPSVSNASAVAGIPDIASDPAQANPSAQPQSLVEFSSSAATHLFPLAQNDAAAQSVQVRQVTEEKPVEKMEQEIIVSGLYSYGNYKIFASGYDMKLFDAGVEYDRHSWGYFLNAQVDYVAEFLPFILLDKPLNTDIFGNPVPKKEKNIRQYVPGIGIFPIGFRLQWRSKKSIKPYLEAKGGMLGFTKKVPSSEAAYENFGLQTATGVQVKMSDRWGLRLGLFSDFHFSDDFVVPVNPGLDVMNANLGISYHF